MSEKKDLENKVISGLFWKFAERISAQLVTFVVSIILARLLLPSDYGAIAIVMVFITIANVFVVSGFGNALVQKRDTDDMDFSTVFYFNIFFSIIVYFVIFFAAPLIADFYNMPILTPVIRVLALKIIVAGINSIQQAYVSRHMMFFRFFWSTLIGTVISAFVGIALAYLGYGIWALVAQYLTNSIIDMIVLWFTVKWRPKKVFVIRRLIPLISFGWKVLAEQLLSSVYNNLKSMIIGKIYTSSDLAYYSKGIQFPDLVVMNINASITSVLFPALSKLQDDRAALRKGLQKTIRISSFFLSPALVGLFVVAPTFITLLLTDKWIDSVPYLRIACAYYIFFPMTTANLEAIVAIGRSDLSLKLSIVKRTLGVTLVIVTMKYGVWAIAVTDLIVTLLAVFLNAYYNKEFFEYSVIEQLRDIAPGMIISIIMGTAVYACEFIPVHFNMILKLIVQIVVGVIVYSVLSYFFNKKDMDFLIKKIKILIIH